MKIEKTNAMRILDQNKVDYKIHSYINTNAISGLEVAEILNQNPSQVFKTLVTTSPKKQNYVFVIPVNKELDLKKAAKIVGEKSLQMLKSKDLLSQTGYIHGGCSPIGMKKLYTTVFDTTIENYQTIFFSGGKIGYQVEAEPITIKKIINYTVGDITA